MRSKLFIKKKHQREIVRRPAKERAKGKGKVKPKEVKCCPDLILRDNGLGETLSLGSWSRHHLRMEKRRRVEFAFADTLSKLKNFRRLLRP